MSNIHILELGHAETVFNDAFRSVRSGFGAAHGAESWEPIGPIATGAVAGRLLSKYGDFFVADVESCPNCHPVGREEPTKVEVLAG